MMQESQPPEDAGCKAGGRYDGIIVLSVPSVCWFALDRNVPFRQWTGKTLVENL